MRRIGTQGEPAMVSAAAVAGQGEQPVRMFIVAVPILTTTRLCERAGQAGKIGSTAPRFDSCRRGLACARALVASSAGAAPGRNESEGRRCAPL